MKLCNIYCQRTEAPLSAVMVSGGRDCRVVIEDMVGWGRVGWWSSTCSTTKHWTFLVFLEDNILQDFVCLGIAPMTGTWHLNGSDDLTSFVLLSTELFVVICVCVWEREKDILFVHLYVFICLCPWFSVRECELSCFLRIHPCFAPYLHTLAETQKHTRLNAPDELHARERALNFSRQSPKQVSIIIKGR